MRASNFTETDERPSARHPQLLVYKASAGSGKTFTLAVQYIKLLIEDPYAYRRILAVTFTNKATAEMKTRILSQLYGIATHDKGAESYLKEVLKTTQKTEQEVRRTAYDALHAIIHDYSRFRIETIDSFFQSVMRNLARELELGANLAIELNNADVLSDAVDSMIEKLDRRSPVLYWLLEYIEERIADDKRWNVSNEIKRFGRNIFDEKYIERGGELRKRLGDATFIPRFRKELQDMRREALDQMKGFNDHFIEVLDAHGLAPADLKSGSRGIASYFGKLAAGRLGNDIRNATVENCLESEENWSTKTSPKRDAIRSLAANELMPMLGDAEELRAKNNMIVNSCDLSLRYLDTLRLLAHIDSEVRLQNQLHNRFLLSDTNALLHSLISEGDATFVYEKIGTTIDTVMIDEFQDTSRMQWENFRLLLQESLAQREGSLIVGDIKQSIYRWRNGDWKILANLGRDRNLRISEQTLDTNWRSQARIIRFNNAVFRAAVLNLNHRYEDATGSPCNALLNAYDDVAQKSAKKVEEGYVRLTFLPDTPEAPYAATTLKQLAEEVGRLVHQGIATRSIAILVRKNKAIPAIADYFDLHTPYRIVSDEAFRLDASLAVCMLVDALRYLASPDDRVSQARLAIAFQHEILQRKDIDLNTILLHRTDDYLPPAFVLQVDALRLMPLYELAERLFALFELQRLNDQDAYLCAFYDAVTDYLQNNSSELTAFLAFWEETLHAKTIPSGEIDGVRILSIHKSKGLEYDTILIPFCDWKMENETNDHLLWCAVADNGKEADVAPFNELSLLPVNYSNSMAESVFRRSYADEQLQLWIDNLNLLYVAFTRACKNLIVWGTTSARDTVSQLIREAIPHMEEIEMTQVEDSDEAQVYEYGTLYVTADASKAESIPTNRLLQHPTPVPIHIEALQSDIDFKQSNRSEEFIHSDEEEDDERTDRTRYIRQGLLLHNLFASIEKADDLPRAIERLCFEGVIDSVEQEKEVHRLAARALRNPEVSDWYDGSHTLYNECSILYTDEEGRMQTRRPDRVMVKGNRATVVDFKFGKPHEAYHAQVKEYMHLLEAMGYEQVNGYLWYVFANEIEEVK